MTIAEQIRAAAQGGGYMRRGKVRSLLIQLEDGLAWASMRDGAAEPYVSEPFASIEFDGKPSWAAQIAYEQAVMSARDGRVVSLDEASAAAGARAVAAKHNAGARKETRKSRSRA
jgi:hypothetical protein